MSNVCTQCFADKELIAFIATRANIGNCNFCGGKDVPCLPIEELSDFFMELLSHFTPSPGGQMLRSLLQGNWGLFSSPKNAYVILNSFLSGGATQLGHADEQVDFSKEIIDNVNYWDILKHDLVTKSRYITDVGYLTDELGWDAFFSTQFEILPGQQLFRARLHHTSGTSAFSAPEMRCPPPHVATAGRANPAGIPYLYLSDNDETVLYEVRATYLDEISVGTFEVKPGLGKQVLISDFTETTTIFHPSKIGDKIKATLLKQKISADLSKPMRRYDSELDYVPTQFICEFIKIYTGVSGIKFRSSLHVTGNNFVIFDQDLMDCTKVDRVRVLKVKISS